MKARMLFLFTETPVHAGGPESVGAIDLPIQRNPTSGMPIIWGSSLKGALKSHARTQLWGDDVIRNVFGGDPPRNQEAPTAPGWCSVVEARLAAFPIPCLRQTMRWVTSPSLLAGVARLARLAGIRDLPAIPSVTGNEVVPATRASIPAKGYLADYKISVSAHDEDVSDVAAWAAWLGMHGLPDGDGFTTERQRLGEHLVLASDQLTRALTDEHGHVAVRNVLNVKTKTVENLFTEECLPAETLLVSLLLGDGDHASEFDDNLDGAIVTVGGSTTVGHGLVWARVVAGVAASTEAAA